MDIDKILDKSKLEANYKKLLSQWTRIVEPSAKTKLAIAEINTTHTFAFEENWGSGNRFPYKDILFTDKALLSQSNREANGKFQTGEPKRDLGEAINFNFFVYAYLGIHNNFYSMTKSGKKGGKIAIPAFGAFLAKELDSATNSNATIRDLSSPECKDYNKEDLFLTPEKGRLYTAYEISNRHNNDFWKYWGSLDYYRNEKDYLKDNWQWKTEFHYHDKVDINNFIALLWPFRESVISKNTSIQNPKILKEIEDFKKDNNNVIIYMYKWDLSDAFFRFAWASYIVSNYFYENSKLPTKSHFSNLFYSEFS